MSSSFFNSSTPILCGVLSFYARTLKNCGLWNLRLLQNLVLNPDGVEDTFGYNTMAPNSGIYIRIDAEIG